MALMTTEAMPSTMENIESLPPLINTKQVSELLGVHHMTTLRYIKNNDIRAVKVGRRYLVHTNSLLDFLGLKKNEYKSDPLIG